VEGRLEWAMVRDRMIASMRAMKCFASWSAVVRETCLLLWKNLPCQIKSQLMMSGERGIGGVGRRQRIYDRLHELYDFQRKRLVN
jgi:hypothetical protein